MQPETEKALERLFGPPEPTRALALRSEASVSEWPGLALGDQLFVSASLKFWVACAQVVIQLDRFIAARRDEEVAIARLVLQCDRFVESARYEPDVRRKAVALRDKVEDSERVRGPIRAQEINWAVRVANQMINVMQPFEGLVDRVTRFYAKATCLGLRIEGLVDELESIDFARSVANEVAAG